MDGEFEGHDDKLLKNLTGGQSFIGSENLLLKRTDGVSIAGIAGSALFCN